MYDDYIGCNYYCDLIILGPALTRRPVKTTFVEKQHCGILHEQLVPCAAKWDTIARYLGFHEHEINNIGYKQGDPESYLGPMLSRWVQFSPPDARKSEDVATLEALKSAVDRAGFAADAKKLTLAR